MLLAMIKVCWGSGGEDGLEERGEDLSEFIIFELIRTMDKMIIIYSIF